MVRSFWFSLLLGVGLVLGSAPLQAATVRLPKVGDPAFSVDVPAGWTYDYDPFGNLNFVQSDGSCYLELSMIVTSDAGTTPLSDFATGIFKVSGAQSYAKSEPSMLAGHAGEAFYGNVTDNSNLLHMKVVIAKLDNSHIAVLCTLVPDGATPEQVAALNALIGLVQLSDPH